MRFFYNREGKPKFPFYWTKSPTRYKQWPRSSMSVEDSKVFGVFDILSRRLPTRNLLAIYMSSHRWVDFSGMC